MKTRPILLLLFLAGLVGILSWSYYAVTRPALEHRQASIDRFVADLDSCCRRKHIRAVQHDLYASVADEEQQKTAAALFRAIARSERAQEFYCAGIIGRLGGEYHPPRQVILLRGTTGSNLLRSSERQDSTELSEEYRRIDYHLSHGNRMVARVLIWAAAAERQQRLLATRLLREPARFEKQRFVVCPLCGNLYISGHEDPFCPHCLTDARRFILTR